MDMAQLLILLGALTGVATLCYWVRLPTIVGFIVAGVAVGPYGMGLVTSLPNADAIADVAVVFLMFTIGLEFSWRRLVELRRAFIRLGLAQVVLTTALVMLIAMLGAHFAWGKALLVGFLVAPSSTALVMKLLGDARDLETPYGQRALSILLFQDLAVIPMMVALPLLAGEGGLIQAVGTPAALARTLLILLGLGGGVMVLGRYVTPLVLEQVLKTRSREVFFFCILFLCFAVAYGFQQCGLSLSLGAFAAGLMLAEGPYGRQVTADILPLRDNFLGLFFASIGMLLDLRLVAHELPQIAAIAVTLFAIKVFVVYGVSVVQRLPASIAVVMGLMLAQIGEFSFILARRGHDLGLLSAGELQIFLTVSVLSMVGTPFLFKIAPRLALSPRRRAWSSTLATAAGVKVRDQVDAHTAADRQGEAGAAPAAHTVIIGFGITGRNIAAALQSLQIPYRAIELNYEAVKTLQREGIKIDYGDATRPEVLAHAGLSSARLVVVAVSGNELVTSIVAAVRRQRPDVQIVVRAQYMRGVEALPREPLTDVVVAEIETAIELLARALRVYGVASEDIRQYMDQARGQLLAAAQLKASAHVSPSVALPTWEALAAIRPVFISPDFAACGRQLSTIDLRQNSGAIVISVFRAELGSTIPGGDFIIKAGDVLNLIGNPEALVRAEKRLRFLT